MNGKIIWVSYFEGILLDELSVDLLKGIRERRESIEGYCDENFEPISKKEAVQWVLERYCNKINIGKLCEKRNTADIEKLYEINDKCIYILHLMGIEKKKIAGYFGVSRQTIYKRIRNYEKSI